MLDTTPGRTRLYFNFLDAKSVVLSILEILLYLGVPVFLSLLFTAHTLAFFAFAGVGIDFDFASEPGTLWLTERTSTENMISLGSSGELIILFINQ